MHSPSWKNQLVSDRVLTRSNNFSLFSFLDKPNPSVPVPLSPPPQRAKIKAQSTEPPAVWKPPPPPGSYPTGGARAKEAGARLSPDSGRGSGGTGSDSSNSAYPEHLSRPSQNG